jgi:ribosome-associated toxin RatA of RatAB toxin-antitoxin module
MLAGEGNVEVRADAHECYTLVCAMDRYPEWQSQVRSVTVHGRDDEDRPVDVEWVSDARVKDLRYRLAYVHEPPHRLSFTYLEGDVKDLSGEYRFEALDSGLTRATYALRVDPGRRLGLLLRGPLADKVRDYVLNGTLSELKSTLES